MPRYGITRFFGAVDGAHNRVSRTSGAKSGIQTIAAGQQGAVFVRLTLDDDGRELAHVFIDSWNGNGPRKPITLFAGPLSQQEMQNDP